MKLDRAIDLFISDWRSYGRINSPHTESAYRRKLEVLGEVSNRRPVEKLGKADVKEALRSWPNPNSALQAHSVYTAFFDWCLEEDVRKTNPARMVHRPKKKQAIITRLTRAETQQLLEWSITAPPTYRWTLYLGVCAGLRNQELCLLEKRDLERPGFIHVRQAAGKGQKERIIPVIRDLEPIIDEMLRVGQPGGTLLRGRVQVMPQRSLEMRDKACPMSRGGMYKLVQRSGQRAGLHVPITPHTLRHAFGDFVAKYAGLRVAQALLGHASVETTAGTYVDRVSLDEMTVAMAGFTIWPGVSLDNQPNELGAGKNDR